MMYFKFPMFTKFLFFKEGHGEDESFSFSTDLDKVGSVWDVSIKNGTFIDVISDSVTIDSPKYGMITLVKIKADVATDFHTVIKEFWVPTSCVHRVEKDETQSTQLGN